MADFAYFLDKKLIVVPVRLFSEKQFFDAKFVFDTGASNTIIDYRIVEAIGYTHKDATAASRVRSAAGKEEGFKIRLSAFETLGKRLENFDVACHALLEQGVEGLLGMNFLEQFD